jgi:stage V sporulation protein R
MAHVYGHCDFFKNNNWFAHTSRKMMDEMANHGTRVRRRMDEVGVEQVEDFMDACLSVEELIDVYSPFIRRRDKKDQYDFSGERKKDDEKIKAPRFEAKEYMDSFVNPREAMLRRDEQAADKPGRRRIPERPERDVLLFILEHAPLAEWQSDVLSIIRDEAYYFAPQGQTKIMNEGWASYWHSTIMIRDGVTSADIINYADHHSGTMASSPTQLNPYKVGIELFRDIEDRWNRGAFGREYDECDDYATRRRWDKQLGQGREKIFEVRKIHNDLTFIDEFLTLDFVREHKLFRFGYNSSSDAYEIESREFPKVKQQLLASLTNRGRPIIAVVDGNYKNRGELFLRHDFSGVELQLEDAADTLKNLERLWNRPVHIETVLEGHRTILSFDGKEHDMQKGEAVETAELENPS